MAFHDVRFPENISYNSRGGPSFKTEIIEFDSGQEVRVSRWSQPRHKFNVSYGIREYSDLAALKEFYIARDGALHSFRFRDHLDYRSPAKGQHPDMGGDNISSTDQLVAVGDGQTKVFQLLKRYTSGPTTRTRSITKPVVSTVVVALDGVQQSSGFSVDGSTGRLSFNSAPANGVQITWGGEFDVHCRFGKSADELLSVTLENFGSGSIPSVEVVEINDPSQLVNEFYYGGALNVVATGNILVSESSGRVVSIDPNGADRDVTLPEITTDYPPGGPWFYIHHDGGANTLTIKDSGGNSLGTISTGEVLTVLLGVDSNDDLTWIVF